MSALMTNPVSATLPRVLTGEERDQALGSMLAMVRQEARDADLAALAKRDPSLLLEDSGLQFLKFGTMLDVAVYYDQVETVRVALEAGVHPDDATAFRLRLPSGLVFGAQRLIDWRPGPEHRLPGPRMLALALKHGAEPDGDVVAFHAGESPSHVRRYAISLNADQTRRTQWKRTLECICILLEGGAKCIDPNPKGDNYDWTGFLQLLGAASALQEQPELDSGVVSRFRDVAKLALAKGACLNYVNQEGIPQALLVAEMGRPTMAMILVELGAADSWKLPPAVHPESFFKGEALGLFREAVMRRRLQLEASAATLVAHQAGAAQSRRRGARL